MKLVHQDVIERNRQGDRLWSIELGKLRDLKILPPRLNCGAGEKQNAKEKERG